jgi:hypothetical protein
LSILIIGGRDSLAVVRGAGRAGPGPQSLSMMLGAECRYVEH